MQAGNHAVTLLSGLQQPACLIPPARQWQDAHRTASFQQTLFGETNQT
jgi:hypothetical protein